MSRLATATYFVPGARDRRVTLSREALEMARRLEHPLTLELALLGRRWALWEPAHLPERLAIATELVHLAETSGTRELALQARAWRVGDLLELGEIEAVDAEIEAYGPVRRRARPALLPLANLDVRGDAGAARHRGYPD
jgi:hypothetical protein